MVRIWFVKRFVWEPAARADLRRLDRETAMRILMALSDTYQPAMPIISEQKAGHFRPLRGARCRGEACLARLCMAEMTEEVHRGTSLNLPQC